MLLLLTLALVILFLLLKLGGNKVHMKDFLFPLELVSMLVFVVCVLRIVVIHVYYSIYFYYLLLFIVHMLLLDNLGICSCALA